MATNEKEYNVLKNNVNSKSDANLSMMKDFVDGIDFNTTIPNQQSNLSDDSESEQDTPSTLEAPVDSFLPDLDSQPQPSTSLFLQKTASTTNCTFPKDPIASSSTQKDKVTHQNITVKDALTSLGNSEATQISDTKKYLDDWYQFTLKLNMYAAWMKAQFSDVMEANISDLESGQAFSAYFPFNIPDLNKKTKSKRGRPLGSKTKQKKNSSADQE